MQCVLTVWVTSSEMARGLSPAIHYSLSDRLTQTNTLTVPHREAGHLFLSIFLSTQTTLVLYKRIYLFFQSNHGNDINRMNHYINDNIELTTDINQMLLNIKPEYLYKGDVMYFFGHNITFLLVVMVNLLTVSYLHIQPTPKGNVCLCNCSPASFSLYWAALWWKQLWEWHAMKAGRVNQNGKKFQAIQLNNEVKLLSSSVKCCILRWQFSVHYERAISHSHMIHWYIKQQL